MWKFEVELTSENWAESEPRMLHKKKLRFYE